MHEKSNVTSKINRRTIVQWALAGASACFASLTGAVSAALKSPTPEQTEGPFYPRTFPSDTDANLLQVNDQMARGEGQAINVHGRVFDIDGNIVSGATVELWQCDRYGTYHHSSDTGRMDAGFQGFGRTDVDEGGNYLFQTIKPAAYPGRPPHIHFKVRAKGFRPLTTQMYFADERAANMKDGIYRSLSKAERMSVTASLRKPEGNTEGVETCQFDIVLAAI